uniref:(northern house mosquito) hypothetical protein n=1 Tax=Culex pipiens TaxID=7175 RepID=A0A8D8BE72_CULPI
MIANGPGVDEVRILFAANLPCVAEMTIIANDPGVVPPKGLKNGTSYKKLYELQSIRTTFVWVRDVCLVDRFLKRIQAFRGFVTTRREGSTITFEASRNGNVSGGKSSQLGSRIAPRAKHCSNRFRRESAIFLTVKS